MALRWMFDRLDRRKGCSAAVRGQRGLRTAVVRCTSSIIVPSLFSHAFLLNLSLLSYDVSKLLTHPGTMNSPSFSSRKLARWLLKKY